MGEKELSFLRFSDKKYRWKRKEKTKGKEFKLVNPPEDVPKLEIHVNKHDSKVSLYEILDSRHGLAEQDRKGVEKEDSGIEWVQRNFNIVKGD